MKASTLVRKLIISALLLLSFQSVIAQKYWVGGNGNWDNVSSWSNTDGGLPGASVPTKDDDVYFTENSGLSTGDSIKIDSIAFSKNIYFTGLQQKIAFYGSASSNLLISSKIYAPFKVVNDFGGYVVMVGTASDYRMKKFDPGTFKGISSFDFVYNNKRKGFQPLAVTSVTVNVTDATCGCDGAITVTPDDGTGSFNYSWFPNVPPLNGDGTNTVVDLCPGKYNVIITDLGDGIPYVESDIDVDGPSPLTIQLLAIDSVNCNGSSDGFISTLVFGGNAPYTLEWDDPASQSTSTASSLAAGDYQLTVTDNTNCQAQSPVYTVYEPTPLVATITDSTLVDCNGNCNGDATVTASGGSPSYTYDWYDAPGTPAINYAANLCEGVYNVEIGDSRGCLDTTSVNITQPTTLQASISDSSLVSCFGFNDGTAQVVASGGTPTYLYDWYNAGGLTTSAVTDLSPGTYNVEVTDDNGCKDTADVIITEPTLLTSSITDTVHILCHGDATGEIEVTAAGGTLNYSYDWYDASGQTTQRITGIIAGSYNVEITDGNGCLDTSSVTVLQPATPLTSSITDTTHNLCFGDCDGVAIVTPTGGTAGYTYDWIDVPGGDLDSTAENLCAGTFNVEVTDANGCLSTSSVTITEPTVLSGSVSVTNLSCKSDASGEIDLTPTGGTSLYTFIWYDVTGTPTTEDVTGIAAGTYNVEITDFNGCTDTVTAVITEPDSLVVSIIDSTNILCKDATTGEATASNSGGTGPFTFTWYDAPGSPTGNAIFNLAAGTYNVEVTDGNGCIDTGDVILTEPALALSSSITDTVHILCKGVCIGEAEVAAAGGTGAYNYDWYNVPGTPTNTRPTGLCAGTYNVEVTDANGCLDTSEVIITEPTNALTVSINDSANVSCNGQCDGEALVTYSGGTPNYTIDWFSSGGQTTDTAFNLCPGVHSVQVTDNNGCSATDNVSIEEPSPLVITINSATLPTCKGDCDGEMSVTASGSVEPYAYNWYDVVGTPTTPNAPGQCAGSYHVEVEDFNGCIDTALVILSDPDTLEYTIDSIADLSCKGVCNGYTDLTPIGGVPGYTVTWFDAPGIPTGETITDLCAGTWNFEILDNNGCRDTGEVTLTEPALELTSSITDTTHNVCFGTCDGDATAAGAGGTAPYSYSWYNAPDSDTDIQAENLCAGTYQVEVTDFNGCLDTSEVIITEPTDITFTTATDISACGSLDTSSASVSVSGGVAPYTYDWYDAGNIANDTVTGLADGTYHCEITDANGCVDTAEVVITSPTELVATIRNDTIHNSCFGDCDGRAVVNRAGGTPTYSQLWYDVPGAPTTRNASNLCAGIYHVELTDLNGCKDTAEVEIREPTLLVSSADYTEATCYGVCDGTVWTDYSGGTAPYSVDWYNLGNATTDTLINVCTGTYSAEITDANGCLDTAEVTVTAPAVVEGTITDTTHNLCFNNCNGIAIVTPSGGTLPYTYDWFNAPDGDTDSTAQNLCTQDYQVEITDANGCLDTASVTITSTSSEIISVTDSVNPSCIDDADGLALVTVSGGIASYTYDWYNAGNQTTDTATGLTKGMYFVEITDNVGCLDTAVATVTDPDTLRAIISDTTFILCFGDSTGTAITTPVGGTPGYTYSWFDAPTISTDSTVTGLPVGTYNVEVTDTKGCLDTASVTITQPTLLILTSDSIPTSCNGICDGRAIVSASGGIAPYTYDWIDAGNQTTDTATGLCPGAYRVEVTDANGCVDTITVGVTEPAPLFAVRVDSVDALCNGGNDGWVAMTGSGGTTPYTFLWDDALAQTTDTAVGLSAGIYNGIVTDSSGCSDTVSITVGEPTAISVVDSLVNASCYTNCDGYIRVITSGGTPGYTHSWSNGTSDTLISGLCAGTYADTITDAAGCVDTFTFVITEPDSLQAVISDTINILCFADSSGSAIVTPIGGTAPYSYNWYNTPNNETDSTATDLLAGTYNVEVTDANGCVDTGSVTIIQNSSLAIATDSIEATCSGICTGSAMVDVTGGVGPYTYDWYTAGNQTTDSISDLCAGSYFVEVSDVNACIDTAEVTVTEPITITASALDSSAASCPESNDGWAVVGGAGGSLPYTYWWNDGLNQTTDTAFNLMGGTYNAAITDQNGCSDTIAIIVDAPDAITPIVDLTNISCNGADDGSITITSITGGTVGYTHSWSTGLNDTAISNLAPGTYADTITDGIGCIDTFTFVITEPDTLKAIISDSLNVTCSYSINGQAIVSTSGGTPVYLYDWYDVPGGDTDPVASGLVAGTYHVAVADANGCTDTAEVTITSPPAIDIETDSVPSTCSGICDGVALVSVTGGSGDFTFDWYNNGNIDNDSLYNVCAGTYNVAVQDTNGCRDSAEVIVTQPVTVVASGVDSNEVSCFGGNDGWAVVRAAGGNPPYTYWWSDAANQTTDTATGLTAGVYSVAVTDVNGCSDTTEITIGTPADWSHAKDSTNASCYTVCDGRITITPSGGTGPYTHSWNTGSSAPTMINLCAGTYADTITDANGCIDTVLTIIEEPDSLELQPNVIQNVQCFGETTGIAAGNAIGGTGPYTFTWGDPVYHTGDTLNNIGEDTVPVIVTDDNGCTDTNQVVVTQPTQLTSFIADTTQANCICNGDATVRASGGVAPYTYLWNNLNGDIDTLATDLCVGDYEVVITDAQGCLDTSEVSIRDTAQFTVSITDTVNISCFNVCDGEAIVTPSQGIMPYSYAWSSSVNDTDSVVTGLCAGVVNVTVTDSIGCIRFASVNITQPDELIGSPMFTSPLCFGDTNGVAWVDIAGGTGPFAQSWDVVSVNDTVYNVGIGTYTDTITDANGCMDTVEVAVTEPDVLQVNLDSINVTCNGAGNGIVWTGTTGGTTPYSYAWDNPTNSTTDTVNDLEPGIYTAIITDFNGCADTDSISITEPPILASSITDTSHVACFCTGEATVTPVGGTSPYNYLWNDPASQTDSVATGLCSGNYEVIILDANGCADTSTVSIRDTSGFTTDIVDTTMAACFGLCNGGALARASNGVQPYNFQWNDPANTNDSLVGGLCAGTYSVTISDAIGCTHIYSINITEPDELEIALNDTNVTCNTFCDGSIQALVSGGTMPYSSVWDVAGAPIDTNYLDSLCPGAVSIEITDANGCVKAASDTIEEPAELIAFISPFSDVSCNGASDAALTSLATGGTSPYQYSWNSGETTAAISGKGPGTYTVTITDTNNCVSDTSQLIIEPAALAVVISDSVNVLCGGSATGSATVTPSGGTAPYSYSWNDGNNQTDSVATDLAAGTYQVIVTDANGCSDSVMVIITEPTLFTTAITNSTATSCVVCDGTAAVTPNGGVGPYTFNWYDAPSVITDSLATGLCASTYSVEVVDSNGCVDTASVVITGPGGLTATITDSTLISCNGTCDGLAVASGIGGTAPYTYSWDDANATLNDSVTDLCAGTYTATITDNAGCIATAQITLFDPQVLTAIITDTNFTGCSAPCSGDATVDGLGGTAPYSFSWNDFSNQTTQQATSLCAGQYIATVTDVNGCTDTTTGIVTGPAGLTIAVDSVVDIECNGVCDGSVAVSSFGGVGNHTYSWNDPSNSTDTVVNNLCAGNYTGQVTDGNGCVAYVNVAVNEPTSLDVLIIDSSDVVCNNDTTGWAVVSYTGGTAPYSIQWNDSRVQTTDTASGLVSGTYTVTVTDANGCQSQASVTISEPTSITATTSNIVPVSCTGFCVGQATLTVGGGTVGGGYTYLWESGETSPSANQLCSGWQTYTVTDGAGCVLVDSVEIIDQNNFTADFTGTGVSCNGDCDGTVEVAPTGGIAPYTHKWQHGPTTDVLSALCPGTYIDTVFDSNGCFLVDSFTVEEPAVFTVNVVDSANLSCFGVCDAFAVAEGNGGTTPYTYSWYNSPGNQVDDTATNLCATTYYVLATDSNGCSAEDTVSITQPAQINVSASNLSGASCNGICDGSATISANGGTGALTLNWFDASALTLRSDLCAGDYTVYAVDDSSCVDSVEFTIAEPDTLKAIITDTTHIVCASVCDGDATVGETGGTAPYTYHWYNAGGVTTNTIINQCAGTYNVEVTDARGCLDTAEVEINDINVLTANVDIVNISCNGLCDGLAIADPVGGVPPYSISWNTSATTDTIKDLCQGNYFLTITDFENCSAVGSGQVIEPAQLTSAIIDSANLDCYNVCDGYATVSPSGGTGPYIYQWNDATNQTGITATGLCAEDYKVVITDARGCLDSSTAFIDQPDSLGISIDVTQANCTNLADGELDITVSGGTAPYSYNWTGPNGFTSTQEDPAALAIGTYTVTVLDDNGCSKIDSAVVAEVNVVNANAGSDMVICNLDSIELQGSGGVLYSWSDGSTTANNFVSPTTSTEYILTVFNNGCSDTDSVVVNVNVLPDVTAIASDYLILDGTSTQLIATGAGTGGTYDWTPPVGLSDPTIPNPTAQVQDLTTYIVTGTNTNGCSDTAMVTIDVATSIVFPDGITPNGDGLNEVWVIKLIEEFPDANVQIFNRWGQKVFESRGYAEQWDGTMNNKKLPIGTYYYLIDLGPNLEKFTGPITLMR